MDIQILLMVLAFAVFAVFGKLVFKNIMNPITMMCGLWAIIMLAYSFHAYDMYYASEQSVFFIGVGIVMFFIGAVVMCGLTKIKVGSNSTKIDISSQKPNYKLLTILNIIAIICFFGFLVETIQLLKRGIGFDYIHRYYDMEEGTIGSSLVSHYIQEWFVWPLCLSTSPLAAIAFLTDSDKTTEKKWFFITTVINLAMFVVITGKRANIGYLIVYFIIVLVLQKRKIQIKGRTKFLLVVGGVALVFLFYYITVSRGSDSIFRSLYIYLCGCVPCFSIKLVT